MSQVVECLLSKCEALNSDPRMEKRRKERESGRDEGRKGGRKKK
jgi:hypothetical protein